MESNKELMELKLSLDNLFERNNELTEIVKAKIYELDEKISIDNASILYKGYIKETQTLFKEIKKANLEIFKNEKEIKRIEVNIKKIEKGIDKERVIIDVKSIIKNNKHLYGIIEDEYKIQSLKYQERMLSIKRDYELFKQNGGKDSTWKKEHGEALFDFINHTEECIKRKCDEYVMDSFYDLVFRVKSLAGEAIDFSLNRNVKGGVDGWIKGKLAKVRINTVGAGGYNIQKFHFRTLIHTLETY